MKVKTVEIPEAELDMLKNTINSLLFMHLDLIGYYETESDLKKHHRAYLHVREEAEEKIKEHIDEINHILIALNGITDETEDIVVLSQDTFHNMIKDLIDLSDTIDTLINMQKANLAGIKLEQRTVEKILKESKEESDKIFKKWDTSYGD